MAVRAFDVLLFTILYHHDFVEPVSPAAFSASGLLYITDSYYHRILVFNSDWQVVQKFGAGGCVA
jgi:hypothetical protein